MKTFFANICWGKVLDVKDVQESWEEFSKKLEEAMQKFIPTHNICSQSKKRTKRDLGWLTAKNKTRQKYLETHVLNDYKKYCNDRNTLRSHTR
jgi:hypothetical protein